MKRMRSPSLMRLGVALVSLAVLGWIDYLTGYEYGFSLFYLIPIVIIGWTGGAMAGALTGAAASVAWSTADYFLFHTFLQVTLWNGFTRLAIYVAMGVLMARLRAERERLQNTNSELEAFSYSVSHDLRSPLIHISSFAGKLQEQAAGRLDEDATRYVGTIIDSAATALKLIDDLLEFSHLGRREFHRSDVNLNEIVAGVRQQLEPETGGRKVIWNVHPLPIVRGDHAMLRVVMLNLLANAVKYTSREEEAVIEIGGHEAQGNHVVFVRDNGAGFNPEYAAKLFRVFERLHDQREFEGSGIGLAIAHRIISRHHGTIWAEGQVGKGATFHFALPATP